jgi:hypothetical protein
MYWMTAAIFPVGFPLIHRDRAFTGMKSICENEPRTPYRLSTDDYKLDGLRVLQPATGGRRSKLSQPGIATHGRL